MMKKLGLAISLRCRIKAAWHVLRGKPTIYGCTFDVAKTLPLHTDTREAFIVANTWR